MYQAGVYRKSIEYQYFLPSLINKPFDWTDQEIPSMVEEAMSHVGELNAFSMLVPNVDFYIQMHVKKEAATSSRIEGTQATFDEVVMPESEIRPEKKDDWQEVQNYILAMNDAVQELNNLPLSMRLIKGAHKILMPGVRGEHKNPGEIRRSQNWIGGSNLKDAFFIPPHQDELPDLLTDLEKFWHNRSLVIPKLIRVAMSHYQFETIHPFLDGNGRTGRMLIPLQMIHYGFLKKPVLYLSEFFEKNRSSYYDSLSMVRQKNNMDQWLKFFLNGVIQTATNGKETLENIIKIRKEYEAKIFTLGRAAQRAQELLMHLFSRPIVSISSVASEFDITFASASHRVDDLKKLGLLEEVTGFGRNRLFAFRAYLNLFK